MKTPNSGPKLLVVCAAALTVFLLFLTPPLHSQLPSKVKAEDKAYREYMVTLSRQLGVSCNSCHNPSNFASADKINFKVAKEHIRLTQILIDSGFDGQNGHPKADCFMCHRGKLKPDYQEPFDPMTMKKAKIESKKSITEDGD